MVLGCYYRVSTEGQQKHGTSLPEQKAKGEAFAEKNGWVCRPLGDVQSGKDPTREGYSELLDAIDKKEIDAVWLNDEDRFARDAIQGLQFINSLIAKKIRLFIGEVERDPADPSTYSLLGIKFLFAQQEWSVIRQRLLNGRQLRANEGKRRIDKVFGYDSYFDTDGIRKLKENIEEGKIVRLIFQKFREGESQHSIAKMLNSMNISTKKKGKYAKQKKTNKMLAFAGKWSQPAIKCILKRPEYIGKVWDWNHDKIIPAYEGYIPAILDESLWEWVESNIGVLSAARNRNGIKVTNHELSRVISCPLCGAKYYFGSHKAPYYSHYLRSKKEVECENKPKNIRVDIENVFKLTFINLFTIPWEIEDYLKEYEKSLFKQNEQIVKLRASLEREVAEKNIVIDKLINSLEELGNDPSVLRRIKERRAEVDKCQSELAKNLKSTEEMYRDLDIMANEFSESTLHLYFSSGPEVRRSIYLDLIESCVIIDKVITVIYRNGKKYIIKIPYRILKNNYIIDVYYKDLFQTSAILENNVLSYPRDRFIQLGENIHPDTLDEQYEIGKGIFIQTNKYMSNAIA